MPVAGVVLSPTKSPAGSRRPIPKDEDEIVTRVGEHCDELAGLLPLLGVERFDRRTVYRALAALVETGARAA